MPEDREAKRPFAAWLQEQRRGALHAELTEALAEVTAAVLEYGRQGQVALTVKIKPAGDGGATVFVGDEVKMTVPTPERPPALWFATEEGNLSRRDPRQPELPVQEVPREETG